MIGEVPYDSVERPNDSEPKAPTTISAAVFHWPPDCFWPFGEKVSGDDP
jgi:hypothetical protein